MPSLVPRSGPSLIGRGLGTRLACITPSKGNLKRLRGIKLQIYVNACGVKNRYSANSNVPMAQTLFSHAWCMGSGNKSRPRLLPRSFLVLTLGAGGGASESSFLILKQPAVATKLEMFKLEILKLEMFKSEILKLEIFGLEMIG